MYRYLLTALALGAAAAPSLAQVQNPANGNHYLAVDAPGIRWDTARADAELSSFMGVQGRLVTINDAAENDFVRNSLGVSVDRFWIGMFQDPLDPGFLEPTGGFVWISGEPVTFAPWNPGEPNDFPGPSPEDYVAFDNNPNWNDAPIDWTFSAGYIIEYAGPSSALGVCNGDGGDQMGCTDCPCGNNSPVGTTGGCLNSAGTSTRLTQSGDPSVSLPSGSTTDLRFEATGAPPSSTNVLLSGNAVAPNNMSNPCFGTGAGILSSDRDGLRCVVQAVVRHGNRAANAMGDIVDNTGPNRVWGGPAQPVDGIAGQGGFMAGQTRFFQITHRDDALAVCMRGLNTSQAVEVTFTP
jgi:hypothetical protein